MRPSPTTLTRPDRHAAGTIVYVTPAPSWRRCAASTESSRRAAGLLALLAPSLDRFKLLLGRWQRWRLYRPWPRRSTFERQLDRDRLPAPPLFGSPPNIAATVEGAGDPDSKPIALGGRLPQQTVCVPSKR